jgi:imidazoleglycerol-phosphate dehydratase
VSRSSDIQRTTNETDIRLSLALDGDGAGERRSGVGFFDHLLDALARHGRLDIDLAVQGDLQTGAHHTVEDTGIALGQALDQALGDRAGIRRYGHAVVPMDEARTACSIDLSGRPFLSFEGELPGPVVADFDADLLEEFMRAIAGATRMTVHLELLRGTNAHHMIEAAFKAFARALREAVSIDPTELGVPSTKGLL